MQRKTWELLVVAACLSGCATYSSYPSDPAEQATYHVNELRLAIEGNRFDYAVNQVERAASRPTGKAKLKEMFAGNQRLYNSYRAFLGKSATVVMTVGQAVAARDSLTTARSVGILSEAEASAHMANLDQAIADGNKSGAIPFVLDDPLDRFPVLNEPSQLKPIVDRTIRRLQDPSTVYRPLMALIDYVQKVGKESDEARRVESLLPTMKIRRNELATVAAVFPNFAAEHAKQLSGSAVLRLKGGDRLLEDDLLQALRAQINGIEWIATPRPDSTVVTIERVRNEERSLPERTQTVTYAQGEVNLFAAALLMPRNASYLYEIVSGRTEIEYGYVVAAEIAGKKVRDEVVRGKVGGEYRRCQNDRIQNVFGGVSSAGFIANGDMQNRCSGPSSISIDQLRSEVYGEIVKAVLRLPSIKAIHDVN